MNYFLAISILGCVVGYSSARSTPSQACSSDVGVTAAARCLEEYGLGEEFIRFQTNKTTAEDLRRSCEHQEKYKQVVQCVFNATSPCIPEYISSIFEQATRDNLAYCDDPQINFECLAEYTRNKSALASCIDSHRSLTDVPIVSSQESLCYGRQLSLRCADEFLRPCDAYTATVVRDKLKRSTPLACYFYPHLID